MHIQVHSPQNRDLNPGSFSHFATHRLGDIRAQPKLEGVEGTWQMHHAHPTSAEYFIYCWSVCSWDFWYNFGDLYTFIKKYMYICTYIKRSKRYMFIQQWRLTKAPSSKSLEGLHSQCPKTFAVSVKPRSFFINRYKHFPFAELQTSQRCQIEWMCQLLKVRTLHTSAHQLIISHPGFNGRLGSWSDHWPLTIGPFFYWSSVFQTLLLPVDVSKPFAVLGKTCSGSFQHLSTDQKGINKSIQTSMI